MADQPKSRGWMVGAVVALIIVGGAVATISYMRGREATPVETRAETAPSSSLPSAPAAAPQARTSAIAGNWRGRIEQPGSRHGSYQLVVTVSIAADESVAARVSYPDLACSGVWTSEPGTATTEGPWRVRETIDRNPERCVPVFIDLSRRTDGGLNVAIKITEQGDAIAGGAIYRDSTAAPGGGG